MVDGTELCSPIHSTFEASVVPGQSGIVMEKNWALPVDQCRL